MRKLVLVLALGALLACTKGYAQNPRERLADRIHDLHLTNDQQAKIAEIRKECEPKIQDNIKELSAVLREEKDKIHAVLTPEQRTRLTALKEEREERREEGLADRLMHLRELDLTEAERSKIESIREEFRPRVKHALENVRGVLSEEQQKAREEALRSGKNLREALGSLNLNAEQKEKLKTAGKDVRGLVHEEMEKIRDVLTPEQQEKVTDLKDERREHIRDRWAARVMNFRQLNLTDDQKSAIRQIRQEFRPRVHEAGNKLRAEIREEVRMILGVLKG